MSDVPALTCPKCGGDMRAYERNGVVVDQCVDCRGLFLDRGELERLVDAENSWHGGRPSGGAAAAGSAAGGAGLGAVVSDVLGQVRGAPAAAVRRPPLRPARAVVRPGPPPPKEVLPLRVVRLIR